MPLNNPTRSPSRRPRGRIATLAAAAAGLALVASGGAALAQDDPPGTINIDYQVNGSTTIASNGSTITLGPATMHSRVLPDGTFDGDMELPGTNTEFHIAGFVPVSANVTFEPVQPTTGILHRVGRDRLLESTTSYYVRLSNIRVAGIPTLAGSNCRTVDPVVIQADTPEGEVFDIAAGGTLTGEYTIGNFGSCGLFGAQTHLINALIPGPGNTVELELSDGELQPQS